MMSVTAASAAKAKLRGEVRARREGLSEAERNAASARIAELAFPLIEQVHPKVVATYYAIGAEADPGALEKRLLASGIEVALPAVVEAEKLVFRRFSPGDPLAAGGFGTLAPPRGVEELEPDLLVVPLVGFDRRGYRLGNGRGHFDRVISDLRRRERKALCLGFAFAVQEVPAVPDEPHDVPMDWVVTEKEVLDLRARSGAGRG